MSDRVDRRGGLEGRAQEGVGLSRLGAAAGGLGAAGVAWGAMGLLRSTLQVRTLPERLTEWLLLFVPLDLFEAGLRRFGFAAKAYAFVGAVAVMVLLLAGIGAVVLRRRWSGPALAGLGIGLWLFTMLAVMPLTGAGLFAADLMLGTGAAVAGYLSVALAYAGALAAVAALTEGAGPAPARPASAPAALLLLFASGAVFAGAPVVAEWSPQPALPAAVVPALPTPVSQVSSAQPIERARPVEAPLAAAAAPQEAPPSRAAPEAQEAPPAVGGEGPWNTADLDAATNGNLGRAAELVATAGVPQRALPAGDGRAPWGYVGEVREFTGIVERVPEFAPGAPPRWAGARRPLGEVLLTGASESALMPVLCVTVGGPGDLRQGDRVRARGYVVGLTSTENATGGTTTGLVVVGEIAPLPGAA